MSDDRIHSGRRDFESRPQDNSKSEGSADRGSINGGLARSQRHRSYLQSSQSESPVAKPAKRPAERDKEEDDYERPAWARISLWIVRKSIVPIIMIIMLLAGLYFGFVFLGKGPEGDVFEWATWRHLYDLVFAES
ncbi:DNA-directed RNA polymerase subunit beta [Paenibacillus sp. GCM10027627]|uniref:DNA-directed RNA polymerase subunit beta n=1 Tax=unclassified Paenibacillus TaxID=185978 RepID=UPI00364091A5